MDYSDLVYISDELGNSLPRTQVSTGDLVISQRGSLGQCAIVDDIFDKLNISANIIAVKNIRESSAKFIHDYMLSSIGQALLERNTSGQVQQKVTTQDIADLIIPVNCDEEKLSTILDEAYSAYMDKLQRADELMDEMSSFLHSALDMREVVNKKPTTYAIKGRCAISTRIDPEYHNPFYTHRVDEIRSTNHDELGNIVEFSTEVWDQKSLFEVSFPYIEISGVKLKENTYDTTETLVNNAPSRARMIVRNGDIIVSTTRPHRGAVATVTCPIDQIQIASTGFCILRGLKRNDIIKEYLQWILLDDYVLLQMLQRSSGGNYPAISGEELKRIVIPIPNMTVQRQICDEAKKRKKLANALRYDAEQEWAEAKARFEKELLGE